MQTVMAIPKTGYDHSLVKRNGCGTKIAEFTINYGSLLGPQLTKSLLIAPGRQGANNPFQ